MKKTDIKYRIDSLSPEARELFLNNLKELIRSKSEKVSSEEKKRIVAYVQGKGSFEKEQLKTYLEGELPDYMIPSVIIPMHKIPVLPNGKVDRKNLPSTAEIQEDTQAGFAEASNQTEEILIKIWEEVLNFSPISVNDNFFEIGGDSILSIQIIAKARKAGIELQANQLFDNQTIAELALFAKSQDANTETEEKAIEGQVELTPIQHWFFDTHKNAPHYWNQAVEVTGNKEPKRQQVEDYIKTLIRRHDAFRLSFRNTGSEWKAEVLTQDKVNAFRYFDLSNAKDRDKQEQQINDLFVKVQEETRLEEGSLFKCLYFDCGDTQNNKVYLLAHHLVTDMISWKVIIKDLISLNGQTEELEKKTSSIKAWGDHLLKQSQSEKIQEEIAFWKAQENDAAPLPQDFDIETSVVQESSIEVLTDSFDKENTRTLLNEANTRYNTKVHELLICALQETICNWASSEHFCLGLEKHGRVSEATQPDISNTVGWFTSYFPLTFKREVGNDTGLKIKSIKEKIRSVPNDGTGYGILRYISGEESLDQQPQVVFNYLGNQEDMNDETGLSFKEITEDTRSPESERNYKIEINAFVKEGKLQMNWSYSRELYKETTLSELTGAFKDNLQNIIKHCTSTDTEEYTPSDFPEAGLSQEDLDNLMQGI
ncbi:hypothetical protein GWK08_09555 [Leptobacterium flavescens]|uniref:Carrier domain-containing protein n=1 Tax=Leptobacterium flavescens TaxID=472055 RepID=A0A6P0US35_9FLAO|nr:condensation domain-containing protein [Leptobacterium flavescens]NER13683.1 hypothetical protein [Leptobacterium flavescens]